MKATPKMPLTVPSPLAPLYAYFPLLTVPNDDATTPAPTAPTLWALGPPPAGHKESLDPVCRQSQAWLRFSGIDARPRWIAHGLGAPGGTLPALHLPQGDLIESEAVDAWTSKQATGKANTPADDSPDGPDPAKPVDPIVQAYTALVETALLPAVLAALYLLPSAPPVVPERRLPFLSALAARWLGMSQRQDRISEIKRLRGGKMGKKAVLDLEEVEREAVEALNAIEVKMQATEAGKGPWFLGASTPSQLDAQLYSVLSIISVLPARGDGSILRTALERCPALVQWCRSHDP
ncbi:hypothetical protein JCM10212_001933 [Sporobolomyces blumeae]